MQKNAMAEKRKVLIDNQELPGLVKVGDLPLEKGVIEVAGFKKIRIIENGTMKIPPVNLTYRLERSTKTRDVLRNWMQNDETHDVVIVQCDASGQEFGRILAPMCTMTKHDPGESDLGSPTYAHVDITLAPWDLQMVPAQQ